MAKVSKPTIRYTSREFDSIKQDLVSFVKRYYPDTFQDFQEAGFGSMVLDTTAYVGDLLSFYLDYEVNESFLDTAGEFENIIKIARQMGYRYQPNKTSTGICSFYALVPARTSVALEGGAEPNYDYAPVLKRGTSLGSNAGITFTLSTDVDFSNTNNEVVVAERDETTGRPTRYAIKSFGRVISGKTAVAKRTVGEFKPFQKIRLNNNNIIEIISVTDSNNNEYFEVPNLAQDTVYRQVPNNGADKAYVKYLLQPKSTPRRFEVLREGGAIFLRFGYGSETEIETSEKTVVPSKKSLDLFGKEYISDTSFDPNTLLESGKFGVSPANTTLTIVYRENTNNNVNIAAGTLNSIKRPFFKFTDSASSEALKSQVIRSLEVTNEEQIVGDIQPLRSEDIKVLASNSLFAQNRAVTAADYKALIFSMPSGLGGIKRAVAYKDTASLKNNINLFLLSEDEQGKLSLPTASLKNNVRFWLTKYKLLNDSVDIFDAKIVNVKIDFIAVAEPGYDRASVLARVKRQLAKYLRDNQNDIGEPIYVTRLINAANEVDGVADIIRMDLTRKTGANYSSTIYNLNSNYSSDGRKIFIPKNVIWEVKFPLQDINGEVR
jgi:hypothetical protein